MMRWALLTCALVLSGCRDWGAFSNNFDAGVGGGTGAGGGLGGGGGSGGGSGTGGAGGGLDPTSCDSRGADSCPGGVLFCDDFEATTLEAAWTVDQMNGTIGVGSACKYRGERALHAQLATLASNVTGRADVSESVSGEPLPGNQFIRAMVRVNSPDPGGSIRLIEVHQPSPGTNVVHLVWTAGQLSVTAVSGAVPSGTVALPMDRWVCVEWQLQEGTPGTARVWLDGAGTPALEGSLGASDLKSVVLGAQTTDHANALGTSEVWFDDLVVSSTRAGCP